MMTHTMKIPGLLGGPSLAGLLMLLVAGFAPNASSQNLDIWTNSSDGSWTDGANWSLGVAPSNNTTVCITNAGSKTVVVDAATPTGNLVVTNLSVGALGGGTNTLVLSNTSPLFVMGLFSVGSNANSRGIVLLNNGAVLTTSNSTAATAAYVGGYSAGWGRVVVSSGSEWRSRGITLGAQVAGGSGSLMIDGGTNRMTGGLTLANTAGTTGEVLMTSAGGYLNVANTTVGNRGVGTMAVSNGTWINAGGTVVLGGAAAGANGRLTIAGGTSLFSNTTWSVGSAAGATGVVVVSGGFVHAPRINLGSNGTTMGLGRFLLTDGAVLEGVTNLVTGFNGSGTFTNQNGGILQFTTNAPRIVTNTENSIVINNAVISYRAVKNADVTNAAVAQMQFLGNNAFRLNASTNVSLPSYVFDSGGGQPYQSLQLVGAAPTWQSDVLTVGEGGELLVSNASSATVAALFTNSGSVRVVNSTVTWKSNMVVSGLYFSDPSTNTYASTLTLTPSGALQGSNGDLFIFNENFINQSTNQAQFQLSFAAVLFTNSATHLFSISNSGSVNIGQGFQSFAEVATNFAIGQLSIAGGNRVTLAGNQDSLTNALYVGWLDIQGALTNSYADVTNALFLALNLPSINLYYDKFDPRNDWLNAWIPSTGYDLWGGGLLLPIPEPNTVAAVAFGVLLLAILRRQRLG